MRSSTKRGLRRVKKLGEVRVRISAKLQRMAEETNNCVAKELFYKQLESLKASKKRKASNLTLFINDEFYERAKAWLISSESNDSQGLSNQDIATIKQKKMVPTSWKNCQRK